MADTRAYFRQYRLGDYLRGHPGIRVPAAQVQEGQAGWQNGAVLTVVGRGVSYHVTVKAALRRGHYDGAESVRAFHLRKVALARDLKAMAGIVPSGYVATGHLVVIQDPDVDMSIAINAPTIGTSVPCEMAGPIAGLAVNDYVYLRTASQYDVAKVTAITTGGTLLTLDVVNNTYSDGVEVFRAHWVAPHVVLNQTPEIAGNDPARDRQVVQDLDYQFIGADDLWSGV